MKKHHILLTILAFVAVTFGPFIWYVATWEPDLRESLFRDLQTPRADHARTFGPALQERAVL